MIDMATPLVQWHEANHASIPSDKIYDFGTVTADEWSEVFTFNIWNNKNGSTDLAKLEKCTITTRDMGGGTGDTNEYNIPVVSKDWFHCQVDSLGETNLQDPSNSVGKGRSKPVGTTGATTKNHAGELLQTPVKPAAQEVLGINNNGNPTDSAGNYVTLTVQAHPPLDAPSGQQLFKWRFLYQYV
jgi:hypothetical protein